VTKSSLALLAKNTYRTRSIEFNIFTGLTQTWSDYCSCGEENATAPYKGRQSKNKLLIRLR